MRVLLLPLSILFSTMLFCQPNSLVEQKLVHEDSTSFDFSFIAGGHFYGNSSNASGYPAGSILASIDTLNNLDASFMLCLGDLFMNIKTDITFYKKSFLSKLNFPLFNAVGNHDVDRAGTYQKEFGATYYSFIFNKNKFIILDSELNDGSISGEQLRFFEESILTKNEENIQNIFIASHRTIWAENDKELEGVFKNNTQSLIGTNFETKIKPILAKSDKPIYWFSGSLGTAPASFFYHEKAPNLYYIATGVRNFKRDAILKVSLINGEVKFTPISLTGESLLPIEAYNSEMWKNHATPSPFKCKLIPMYILNTVFHRYFWYGCIVSFISFIVLRISINKFRERIFKKV